MNLPAIDIPIPAQLPIDIPLLVHPAVVHFAISLPIILLLIEFINLIMKRRALSVTTITLIILIGLIFFAAFLTGRADAKETFALLNPDVQAELKFHKLLGIYLVYSTVAVLIFKIISMIAKKIWFKILYFVILIAFIGLTLFQGKEGGELVYEHGVNVKAVQVLEDKIEKGQEAAHEEKAEPAAQEEVKHEEAAPKVQEEAVEEKPEAAHEEKAEPAAKEEVKHEEAAPKAQEKAVEEKPEAAHEEKAEPAAQEEVKHEETHPVEMIKEKIQEGVEKVKEKAEELKHSAE